MSGSFEVTAAAALAGGSAALASTGATRPRSAAAVVNSGSSSSSSGGGTGTATSHTPHRTLIAAATSIVRPASAAAVATPAHASSGPGSTGSASGALKLIRMQLEDGSTILVKAPTARVTLADVRAAARARLVPPAASAVRPSSGGSSSGGTGVQVGYMHASSLITCYNDDDLQLAYELAAAEGTGHEPLFHVRWSPVTAAGAATITHSGSSGAMLSGAPAAAPSLSGRSTPLFGAGSPTKTLATATPASAAASGGTRRPSLGAGGGGDADDAHDESGGGGTRSRRSSSSLTPAAVTGGDVYSAGSSSAGGRPRASSNATMLGNMTAISTGMSVDEWPPNYTVKRAQRAEGTLGAGSFGTVFPGIDRDTGEYGRQPREMGG